MPLNKRSCIAAVCIAVVALLFFLVYRLTLFSPFQFDDYSNVVFHRAIRYLDNPRVFLETMHQRERPITNISLALNYMAHGLRVDGYHLANIFLHILNAVLVGLVVGKIFPKIGIWNWIAALLFLFHPMALDAVTFISSRSSLLVLFFTLATCYVALLDWPFKLLSIVIVLALGCLAVLSKESGAVIPLWLMAVGLAKQGRIEKKYKYLLGAFFLLALCLLWLKKSYLVGAWSGYFRFQGDVEIHNFREGVLYYLSMWWSSLRLFFRPDYLSIDHSVVPFSSIFTGKALVLWATLFCAPILALWSLKKGRALLFFSLACFFIALVPTHSIVPTLDPVGERNLYLALPGFSLFIVWLLMKAPSRIAYVFAGVILLFCFSASMQRAYSWRSSVAVWRNAYNLYPSKVRILLNYGNALRIDFGDHWAVFNLYTRWMRENSLEHIPFDDQEAILAGIISSGMRAMGSVELRWRESLQKVIPGKKNEFWQFYLLGEVLRLSGQNKKFVATWSRGYQVISEVPVAGNSRDEKFWRSRMNIQMARFLADTGNYARAAKTYEEVFAPFSKSGELPYWPELLPYAKVLRKLHSADRELAVLQKLASYQLVYKIYSGVVLRRLAELYQAQNDWARASDAYGELIRTEIDNVAAREGYSAALAHFAPRSSAVQAAQAKYFSKRRVDVSDLREAMLR